MRSQFHHVTDIAPTIYEIAGMQFPDMVNGVKQIPLEGKSSSIPSTIPTAQAGTPSISKCWAAAASTRMAGGRAAHIVPWKSFRAMRNPGQHPWELYDLNQDYSQAHDLAEKNPQKLKELDKLFDYEAHRNNIYPLAPIPALLTQKPEKKQLVLHEGASRIRSHRAQDDITFAHHHS